MYELFGHLAVGGWVICDEMNREGDQEWLCRWRTALESTIQAHYISKDGRAVALIRKESETKSHHGLHFDDWKRAASWWCEIARCIPLIRSYRRYTVGATMFAALISLGANDIGVGAPHAGDLRCEGPGLC
jgi:hypothetical protein